MSLDELPFPQTDNVQQLLKEMNREKEYDDTDFIKTYCACECINASEKLLDLILFQKKDNIEVIKFPRNGKNNVLMYTGNMAKNGLTSSIMNLLSHIDLKERNYYITFPTHKVEPYKEILQRLPEGVNYIPTKGRMNASINEKTMLLRYRTNTINAQKTLPKLERLYDYEVKRCYGDAEFSNVIHFTGYEFRKQLLYSRFLEANKVIYVHNNVIEEIKVRRNLHPVTLKYAYNHYDAVAMVTEDMEAPTSKYCSDKEKMKIATNIFDWKGVKEKAEQSIQFDEETECNIDKAELEKILESDAVKFINIGRFSPEKGHRRLLNSFNKLWKENKETYLIIIGGHGVEYEKTLNYAAKLDAADHIIIIKYMTNPFPVLKNVIVLHFLLSMKVLDWFY